MGFLLIREGNLSRVIFLFMINNNNKHCIFFFFYSFVGVFRIQRNQT